ncbi:hypothetical protein WG68_15995 [Arsukibacterium ikkense]|uniref:DNA repair protein n=1 Tax=Arsukibacterium ikkense TaxID=336831 RepID=A0A0M2V1S8_9GAMM|nr:DUF2799 domain-containing protein [Arsukibacterium ikkense]KKO44329.1 hypothetical protein WG68_15995 [Arsukibacterium ikkense]
MTKKLWLALLALATLHGCATLNKSQCLTADWRTIGFEDGAKGKAETAISTYRQDCAKHGITPDLDAYRLGHRQGSENFCTSRSGFNLGKRGGSYQGSCTAALEADFLQGYRDGQQLHGLQQAANSARADLDRHNRQISNLDKSITVKTDLLVEDGLLRDERIQLLNEIEAMKAELIDMLNQLPALQREVRRAEQQQQQAEQRFAAYQ